MIILKSVDAHKKSKKVVKEKKHAEDDDNEKNYISRPTQGRI